MFAQDQWTICKLTLNLGVRFDHLQRLQPGADAARRASSSPAIRFPAVDNVPNWKDITPRLGAGLRPVRQRQDRDQGVARPLREAGDDRHRQPQQPGRDDCRADHAHLERHVFGPAIRVGQLRARLRPDEPGRRTASAARWPTSAFGTSVITTRYRPASPKAGACVRTTGRPRWRVQHELRPGVGVTVGYFRTRGPMAVRVR